MKLVFIQCFLVSILINFNLGEEGPPPPPNTTLGPFLCEYKGNQYREGESIPDHHCAPCTCEANGIDCLPRPCARPLCPEPETKPDECCPTCPEGTEDPYY